MIVKNDFIVCLGPTAVRNLTGEPMLFSVLLTWSEPVSLNGILNRYTIRYSVNGSSEITNTTRDTTFSITDLNPNIVVSNIRVIAATGAGDGPPQMLNDITTQDRPREFINVFFFISERDTYRGNTIENRGCLFIYIYVWTYVCHFVL